MNFNEDIAKRNEIKNYIEKVVEIEIKDQIDVEERLYNKIVSGFLSAIKFLIYAFGIALILYALSFLCQPLMYAFIIKLCGPEVTDHISKLIAIFKA